MNIIIIYYLIAVVPLELKYPFSFSFYSDLNKFINLNPQKESTKNRKVDVYDKCFRTIQWVSRNLFWSIHDSFGYSGKNGY